MHTNYDVIRTPPMTSHRFRKRFLPNSDPKITGTRVALTASPSSTIVEECIAILRKLHQQQQQQRALQQQPAPPIGSGTNYIGGWGQKINEYMCLKLSLVNEIVAEIPLLQMQLPNETDGNT